MQAVEILDIKQFMQLLLQSPAFDFYEMVSATLRTDMDYQIDGRWNPSFFSEDETDTYKLTEHTYLPWALAKEKIFSLIKGKKTPTIMKIVFKVSKENLEAFLTTANSPHNSNDIDGIYFNILFQEQKLNVTCQISYKIFTLDKNLEEEFFSNFITLLKSNNIAVE
jgi:hypothetical protein